jgi:hypothetical protein
MRLMDLALAYLVVGAGCAWALRARRLEPGPGLVDALLTLTLWPLYAPMLGATRRSGAPARRSASPRIERERALLHAAIDAAQARMATGALASLLPTREQLATLTGHLERLDAKVQELDEVLAAEEFDLPRVERRMREADAAGVGSATAALEGARRLAALRERAARERDDLLGLCARLRMQVTVLRFTDGAPGEHLGELVGEILARIEGVGAALDPAVTSGR